MLPAVSRATIVTVFAARLSGMEPMAQLADPVAKPAFAWSVCHLTCAAPVPPDVTPDMEIEEAVVITMAVAGF